MNAYLQQLIERERSRISSLRQRIEHYEQRLCMLIELSQDDEKDTSIVPSTQTVQSDAVAAAPGVNDLSDKIENAGIPETKDHPLPKKISANSLKLLRYFGQGQKTLDEATAFSEEEGLKMDRRNITSFANIYRNKFGLIESPAVGRYRLTDKGQEFVRDRYGLTETPNETAEADPAADLV